MFVRKKLESLVVAVARMRTRVTTGAAVGDGARLGTIDGL